MKTWKVFLILSLIGFASGHGNIVKPPAWFHRGGSHLQIGCGVLGLSTDQEYSNSHNGKDPDCMQMWYSNHVTIPGPVTIPDDMSQQEVKCVGQAGAKEEHPWNAPGTAKPYGPCGALGGNPYGCHGDGVGHFGDCCGNECDGFAIGNNAELYDWPGDVPVTEWLAGSQQEVQWYVSANHAGGYSYRLCKMPERGIKDLTEECFQETPLDFVGDKQWVVYANQDHRTQISAKRTTEGTYPPGSMWTANPLVPPHEESGNAAHGHGMIIDKVVVPENLQPGEYVLSFRWDCKCSPQVWGACSNILIL